MIEKKIKNSYNENNIKRKKGVDNNMLSQLVILAILIFLNAFFAASEIGFISLNDAKVQKQARAGTTNAK